MHKLRSGLLLSLVLACASVLLFSLPGWALLRSPTITTPTHSKYAIHGGRFLVRGIYAVASLAMVGLALRLLPRNRNNRKTTTGKISRRPVTKSQTVHGDGGLEISDLHVTPASRPQIPILRGVSLRASPGSTVGLVGHNGSGKSTLGRVLLGDGGYEVISGSVRLGGQNILACSSDERANEHGIFVSWQSPPDIPGVTSFVLLQALVNAKRRATGKAELSVRAFDSFARQRLQELGAERLVEFLDKPVNEGLSGGERKRVELLHLCILRPHRLLVVDELDSGIDKESVDFFVSVLTRLQRAHPDLILVVISHNSLFLNKLNPDQLIQLQQGRVHTLLDA